ncbi:MAG: hypothetical protein HQ509_00640 [Candidatus Marinimicrobia bacterium]|nr:hypothetical protein [Candidatus Neomarinimicrobiota bacterium]
MASLGMKGLFNLTSREIDSQVTKTSPGNYALGRVSENKFYVYYVGRSDTDLNGRLKDWVDEYDKFRFSYAASPKAAFKKECQNYHDFGETDKLDNKQHPQRPDDSNWKCPVCDIFN